MDNFDFDAWTTLARTSPDEFERRRRVIVERLIANSYDLRRMQGLQCRIDLERLRARTPMKSCLRLSSLMWDALFDLNNQLHHVAEDKPGPNQRPFPPASNAKIIYFPLR